MQNLVNDTPTRKNYDFIDAIRCIAMMSIVAEHSIGSYTFPLGSTKYWSYLCIIQFAKFGTVAFFLLAGFLIGEKFSDYTPVQYIKRRFATTFGPWIFWSLVYVLALIIHIHIVARIYHDNEFNLANILHQVKIVYLYTNYWFIINFLISITILLVFSKYLYSYYFGSILGLFTLFYAINIHYEWIDPSHTTAILGFVFFLWLGAQLRKNWEVVERRIRHTSYLPIIALIVVTFGISLYEMSGLTGHSKDPMNTLRFSNVLYSLSVFTLLLKIRTFKFTDYLKPRQTTYGIYLVHYIIIIFLLPEIFIHFNIHDYLLSIPEFFLFKICTFLLACLFSFSIVFAIGKSPLKKLIGN